MVINLCRTSPSELSLRLYGLNLLVNMSVLEHLHDEFMTNIHELDLLIASARESNEEALAAGKLLVNLSTNKFNLKSLLKLTVCLRRETETCRSSSCFISFEECRTENHCEHVYAIEEVPRSWPGGQIGRDSFTLYDILLQHIGNHCQRAETSKWRFNSW